MKNIFIITKNNFAILSILSLFYMVYSQTSFSDQIVIVQSGKTTDDARSIYAVDIDGDGDQDVISASINDDKIAWYDNLDGKGNFGEQQIVSTSADRAWAVYAADLDSDGDYDILSASDGTAVSKIAWYKNKDGLGTFSDEIIITTEASGAVSVYAADLDGDGD